MREQKREGRRDMREDGGKSSVKKDIRMQMRARREKKERKIKEESTDRESKGDAALTSKRAKREQESATGRDGESAKAGCAGRRRQQGGEEGMGGRRRERLKGRRARTKSGTKRPRV